MAVFCKCMRTDCPHPHFGDRADVKEDWKPGEESLSYQVRVSGPDAVVHVYALSGTEVKWLPYRVVMVAVSTLWPVTEYAFPVRQRVAIWAVQEGKKHDPIELHPGQLREIPSWLDDIVLRASPRDVDWPDMKANPHGTNG